ncbi:hypothetical protein [Actinomadura vinacea]
MTVFELRRRLPGIHCWWGIWTGEWWALVPAPRGHRLVHAATVDGLAREITTALAE